jgi:altronate hydrolase
VEELVDNHNLAYGNGHRPLRMTIQESGGIRATINKGIEMVESLLPQVNACTRTAEPVSELNLALECGGSDAWSGVTANPALGLAADELVRQGGTACLAETTEIYGAEHLLTRRAVTREVGEKLLSKVRWWEQYTKMMGVEIDNNPSPGNKAGGLTNIYEKSLGAVAKGGSMPLADVFGYAESITTRGFVFMDTPGYDPVEATGQVAGGCNLLCFTTGRGSVFGFRPTPSIKICTNTATYNKMTEDMDVNAGKVIDGVPLADVGSEIFELLLRVASGEKTKSELMGIGEDEFQPWNIGGTV